MPLVPSQLETAIRTQLKQQLQNKQAKLALCKKLDGGPLAGAVTTSKNISKALGNISLLTKPIANNTPDVAGAEIASGQLIKKVTANEWANGISDAVYSWLDEDIIPVLAKVIADEVTTYIKSATIIVQPGQVVTTPAGPGATSSPSSPATIN
jgi:hypothetical protein